MWRSARRALVGVAAVMTLGTISPRHRHPGRSSTWMVTSAPLVVVSAGLRVYFFNPAVQFNTTVNGTDALGPTGAMRRNCFPSAVTSPTIVPAGV